LILSYLVEKNILLYLIIAGTIFSFLTFNYKKFHLLHKTSDESLGTLFYPIGILSSYILLYKLPLFYFQTSLMVLAVSDTLANFSGLMIKKGNLWIRTFHDKKSLYGIAAYTLSSCAIFFLFLPGSLTSNIPFIVFALLWALNLEIASKRGSDNLSIPLGLALLFLLAANYDFDYIFLSSILLIMAAGCFLLFKSNILTRLGSFIAFLLGFYFAGFAGWQWLSAVLLFFLSSAAFTKIHYAIKYTGSAKTLKDTGSSINLKVPDSKARNAWQVIANIIWALFSSALYLLTQNEIFILFFIAFVAAVTADTWASEIGPLLNKKCFSLSKMKMMPAGTNGGISFYGSLAALAGAVLISSFSYFLFFNSWDWLVIAILSVSAFLACFADSLLGAFVEDKMLHMNFFKKRKSSESISPNDLVNMMGSLTAFVFYLLLTWITSV
jgi:uncharacterized protein (TIGR00297 family)